MAERRVYIGKMPDRIDEGDLRKHLSIFGPITDMTLRTGYAIVNFESEKDAMDVVSVLGKRRFLGADLLVSLYIPRAKLSSLEHAPDREPRTRCIHGPSASYGAEEVDRQPRRMRREYSTSVDSRNTAVFTNLNKETCWQQLKDFGRSAGRVAYCETSKRNRRTGFIKYESKEDADHAIKELNGKELMNCCVRVLSLHDYDCIREAGILRAGRMRSRSPEQRPVASIERRSSGARNIPHGADDSDRLRD